uniref:Cilia- and flagella-associated protein 43 n=1 Tax=Neolamprologus brichardi TaxID=32507 RepID=A0A3Q4HZ76_NEOBR
MNWLQLCSLGTASLTVWNIAKSDSLHVLQPSTIKLPAPGGTFSESQAPSSQNVSNIMAKLHQSTRARLTPSAICWTATSKLYVGCAEGFLLLVDPESHSFSVLFNPTSAESIPELRRNSFQRLTPNNNGLIAVGKESVVHLQIKGTQINIAQTWQLERPVTTVMYSPDYKTLLFSSNTGQIYVLNPAQSDRIVKIFDVLSGNFVTATLLHNDKSICVVKHLCCSRTAASCNLALCLLMSSDVCVYIGCSPRRSLENCSCGPQMASASVLSHSKWRSDCHQENLQDRAL